MSESDVKQVIVALSHPDELNPRRRRRTRKFKDDVDSQAGGEALVGAVDASGSTQATQAVTVQKQDIPVQTTTVSSTPSSNPVQSVTPLEPRPSLATVTMVGGGASTTTPGAGAVHIREKKNTHAPGVPGAGGELNAPNAPAPKIILHKKRITNAPVAQTLKKPKFIVSAPAVTSPSGLMSTLVKTPPLPAPKNDKMSGGVGEGGMDLKPVKGGAATQGGLKHKRRFTERRIKIEVKPTIKTRKSRKVLKDRIEAMPIQAVRRLLIKKGILKPKATVPPELMMRSMLQDYYLLKQSE